MESENFNGIVEITRNIFHLEIRKKTLNKIFTKKREEFNEKSNYFSLEIINSSKNLKSTLFYLINEQKIEEIIKYLKIFRKAMIESNEILLEEKDQKLLFLKLIEFITEKFDFYYEIQYETTWILSILLIFNDFVFVILNQDFFEKVLRLLNSPHQGIIENVY